MYCRITLLALLILLALASGCRQCQSCYDYCGPLPDEPCDFLYRRNSILYRGDEVVAADEGVVMESDEGMTIEGGSAPLEGGEGEAVPAPETDSAPQLSPVPDPYTSGMRPRRIESVFQGP